MSSLSEETEILRALYAGSCTGFDAFLRALSQALRAGGAVLVIGAERRWSLGNPPALPAFGALRDGRIYAQGDLPGSDPSEQPLRLVGVRTQGIPVTLALTRPRDDFRAADSALLSRLAPHLETAAGLWHQRQAEAARARREGMLTAGLGAGWLVLDAATRVVETGDGARLARAGLSLGADGRLDLVPDSARALRRAVDAALVGEPSVVILSESPRIEAAIHAEGGQALALLRFAPCARDLPGLAGALAITRSESRLVAALTDGATLAEAAGTLGWSLETARSTSKQVFSKLGVSGQPALVRRVLNGAHWLLPQGPRPVGRP